MANVKKSNTPSDTVPESEPSEAETEDSLEGVDAHDSGLDDGISQSALDIDPLSNPAESNTQPPASTPSRRGGFLPLLAGGIIAGGIGFSIAQYSGNDGWPFKSGPSATDILAKQIETHGAEIESIQTEVLQFRQILMTKAETGDLNQLVQGLERSEAQTQDLAAVISEFDRRLSDLENRPIPDVGATKHAVEVYAKELAAMRAMFEEELKRIEAAQGQAAIAEETAAKVAKSGIIHAALSEVQAAMKNGEPFSAPLETLENTGFTIPEELKKIAVDGILNLQTLRQSFPPAARLALARGVKDQESSGATGGLTAFLRNQLGVRSLEPRQGNDTDAILSRSESAVENGDIERAIFELKSLSPTATLEMEAWVEQAQRYLDAEKMITALLASSEG